MSTEENTLIDNSFETTNENNQKRSILQRPIVASASSAVVGAGVSFGASKGEEVLNNEEEAVIEANVVDEEGEVIESVALTDLNNDGVYEVQAEEIEIVTDNIVENSSQEESSSNVFDINTAPVATQVTDNMSFSEAFGNARQELGAGGVFSWNGQSYNTFYAEELDENYQPTIAYETIETNDLPNEENVVIAEPIEEDENIIIAEPISDDDTSPSDLLIADNIPEDVPNIDLEIYEDDLANLDNDGGDYDNFV